jgi:hypothetical protein
MSKSKQFHTRQISSPENWHHTRLINGESGLRISSCPHLPRGFWVPDEKDIFSYNWICRATVSSTTRQSTGCGDKKPAAGIDRSAARDNQIRRLKTGPVKWVARRGARKKKSRKSEKAKGAQCPTLSRVQILQLVSTSYSRYVAGDATGHLTNARRVGPADLSTGTRPWHLGTTRPLPGLSRHRTMQVSQIDGAFLRPPGTEK